MKRTPLKRKPFKTKKSPVKALVKKADKLWSQAILMRDGYQCQKCGKTGGQLHPHHIFSRSIRHIRHDLVNGITLCPLDHTLGIESAHKNPEFFRDFLINKNGQEWFDDLKFWAKGYTLKPNYADAIETLTAYIEEHK